MRLCSKSTVGFLYVIYVNIFVQFVSDLYFFRERERIYAVTACLQGYY